MPRIIPEPRYFSVPSMDVGADVRRKRALNCWPWVWSLTHSPEAVIHSPAEIMAAWPITVTRVAMSARLDPQNTKAVVAIMEGDTLDKASQNLLGRRLWLM